MQNYLETFEKLFRFDGKVAIVAAVAVGLARSSCAARSCFPKRSGGR
jgi:hypothetical protein